ncbi:MAG: ATP-binding protein [Sphaerochaetaceae bacterium]|nr:ATP-binding protein [Sphaerochaetaceae bacterium]
MYLLCCAKISGYEGGAAPVDSLIAMQRELLIMENGRRIGIEYQLSEAPKPTKSMYVALEDLALDSIYVIYPGKERYPLHERIEVISLSLFIGECLNHT